MSHIKSLLDLKYAPIFSTSNSWQDILGHMIPTVESNRANLLGDVDSCLFQGNSVKGAKTTSARIWSQIADSVFCAFQSFDQLCTSTCYWSLFWSSLVCANAILYWYVLTNLQSLSRIFSIHILNLFLEIFISVLKLVPELLSKKLFLLEMIEYLGNSLDLVTIWIQLDCIWEEETLPPHHQADTCWEKYLKIVAGIKEIAI